MIVKKFFVSIYTCLLTALMLFALSCDLVDSTNTIQLSSRQMVEQVEAISNEKPYQYFLYAPDTYSGQKYPLVIFLHGAGERGDPLLNKVINHGPLKPLFNGGHIREQILTITETEFNNLNTHIQGSFVVAPQCRNISGSNWWQAAKLKVMLDDLLEQYPAIDQSRIYITGLSMGGGGTWDFVRAHPSYFAAALPICAATTTGSTNLLEVPTWAFHSFGDGTVGFVGNTVKVINESVPGDASVLADYPHNGSTANAATTTQTRSWSASSNFSSWVSGTGPAAGQLNLTVYTDNAHDSWTRTYNNSDVWDWLFSKSKW